MKAPGFAGGWLRAIAGEHRGQGPYVPRYGEAGTDLVARAVVTGPGRIGVEHAFATLRIDNCSCTQGLAAAGLIVPGVLLL